MGESHTLFKLVLFLGIMFLLIGLLSPGSDAAFTTFSNSLRNFPTFQNPFDQETYEIAMPIVADGSIPPAFSTDNGTISNCDTSSNPGSGTDWFGCLTTHDQGTSFASTNATETEFRVVLDGPIGLNANYPVLGIKVLTECRGVSANQETDYVFFRSDDVSLLAEIPGEQFTCPASTFTNVTFIAHFDTTYPKVGNFTNARLLFNPVEPTTGLDVSFISVTMIYGATQECTGTDTLTYIGCIISGFFNFVIKIGRFIINGILFTAEIIFWFLNIIYSFITLFAFFFAIPGAPTIVQGIITAIFVGIIMFIAFVFLKVVRGSGTTG